MVLETVTDEQAKGIQLLNVAIWKAISSISLPPGKRKDVRPHNVKAAEKILTQARALCDIAYNLVERCVPQEE